MAINNKKLTTAKIPTGFFKDMMGISKVRWNKGFVQKPHELGLPEQIRLLTKTNGYKQSLKDLETLPKRRDFS